MKLDLSHFQLAHKNVLEVIRSTGLDYSVSASQLLGKKIYFKHENLQRTGSFKLRGAYNKIKSLNDVEKKQGVVASSAGNHAQGVALSCQYAGVSAKIVMPITAPLNKVQATQSYGAEVILHGQIYDEAYECAKQIQENEGRVFIHPYEDPYVIAGQGTIAFEMLQEVSDLSTIVVPVGGGGLISGVAMAAKLINPQIKIIGVQSEQAPGMVNLFHRKNEEMNPLSRISTIADGIAVKKPSQIIYDNFISKYVDEMVTVTDDELAHSIVFLLERSKSVSEGSGAAGLAAIMKRPDLIQGEKCGIIISGGNIDLNIISKVIERGQMQRGKLVELSIVVDDAPGSLSRLTQLIAKEGGNVLQVHHDRLSQSLSIKEAKIDFVLETKNHEHIERIKAALKRE